MTKKQLILKLATLSLAMTAQARELPVPHGPDINERAAACGLGPKHGEFGGDLGQTTKAGRYNQFCKDLTDAEICLAIVKSSISYDGEQRANHMTPPAKVEFCLEEFKKNLLED